MMLVFIYDLCASNYAWSSRQAKPNYRTAIASNLKRAHQNAINLIRSAVEL